MTAATKVNAAFENAIPILPKTSCLFGPTMADLVADLYRFRRDGKAAFALLTWPSPSFNSDLSKANRREIYYLRKS